MALLALTAVACNDGVELTTPFVPRAAGRLTTPAMSGGSMGTLDEEFRDLARRFPGFGGLYRDSTGGLVARFTDLRAIDPAAEPALLEFARDGQYDLMGPPSNGDPRITFRRARYDFTQLSANARTAAANKGARAFSVDINEAENQVVVAAEQQDSLPTARRFRTGGLSELAFRVEIRKRPLLGATTNLHATTAAVGGVEIGVAAADGGALTCTAGFTFRLRDIATRVVSREYYLVTASHCSRAWGSIDRGAVRQPARGRQIGIEVFEAPTLRGESCPNANPCQIADLSVYQINDRAARQSIDLQLGLLAWPTLGDSTFTFNHYQSWGDRGAAAGPYGIVGTTSGRIEGRDLRSTCATVDYDAPFNRTLTCQNEAWVRSHGGDSGAPVYGLSVSGRPILRGIVSGHSDWSWWNLGGWHFEHTTWYSPAANISTVLRNRWPGKEILIAPDDANRNKSCAPGSPGIVDVSCWPR